LASNVLGFVGTDAEGLEGLELAFDERLRGEPRVLHVLEGADGRTYEIDVAEQGRPGDDLTLTLDAELQFICEEEIAAGVSRYRADGGMIVVLDPATGDVLAMAQDATYDLNRFWASTAEERRNAAVTQLFEPGSSFKVFTGLAALDAGVVDVADTFDGNDGIEVSGHVMHNADWISYGTVSFAQIIEDSINTGMIRVAQRLGEEALHGMLVELGFGRPTGIELPGEVGGSSEMSRTGPAWPWRRRRSGSRSRSPGSSSPERSGRSPTEGRSSPLGSSRPLTHGTTFSKLPLSRRVVPVRQCAP